MGDVVDIFEDIFDAVTDVVDHVVEMVTKTVSIVGEMLQNPVVQIVALASFAYFAAFPAITTAFSDTLIATETANAIGLSTLGTLSAGTATFIESIAASFSAMLTAIHFDTILATHNIALLVSEDYRVMMNGVYSEMSEVSAALGFYPQFLALAIRNSRTLVLDVSSTLGMEYDMAQVQWLSTFQEYLHKFNEKAREYENNPAALFEDIDNWIDKPAMDTKGSFMARTIASLDRGLTIIDTAVKDTIRIREDLHRLADDLPDNIRKHVKPWIDDLTKDFDRFVTETYDPYKTQLDSIIKGLNKMQDSSRKDLDGIVRRLKKPGDYLMEIDKMGPWDRLDQERKVADISTREYRRDVAEFTVKTESVSAELEKIREALKHVSLMPLEFPGEIEKPSRPAGVKAEPKETWFVGDY